MLRQRLFLVGKRGMARRQQLLPAAWENTSAWASYGFWFFSLVQTMS
jgi:hypothetical protein